MMKCVQCTKEMTGCGDTVCKGCVDIAMHLMETALGGRPTPEQIYRMFDAGGAGTFLQFQPKEGK